MPMIFPRFNARQRAVPGPPELPPELLEATAGYSYGMLRVWKAIVDILSG